MFGRGNLEWVQFAALRRRGFFHTIFCTALLFNGGIAPGQEEYMLLQPRHEGGIYVSGSRLFDLLTEEFLVLPAVEDAECLNYKSIHERSWTKRVGIVNFVRQELDRSENDSMDRFEYDLKASLLNDYAATRDEIAEMKRIKYFLRSFSYRMAAREYATYVFGNGRYEIWIIIERLGCIYSIDNSHILSKSTL